MFALNASTVIIVFAILSGRMIIVPPAFEWSRAVKKSFGCDLMFSLAHECSSLSFCVSPSLILTSWRQIICLAFISCPRIFLDLILSFTIIELTLSVDIGMQENVNGLVRLSPLGSGVLRS